MLDKFYKYYKNYIIWLAHRNKNTGLEEGQAASLKKGCHTRAGLTYAGLKEDKRPIWKYE